MKFKGTWVMGAVVAGLCAYAYFVEFKGKENEKAKKDEASKVFSLVRDQVNEIDLESPKQKLRLTRGADGWKIEEPVQDLADNDAVETWVTSLLDEKSNSTVVEGNDIKWNYFGLEKDFSKLTLKTNAGASESVEIAPETKNVEGNVYFRKTGENKVLLGNSLWSIHGTKKLFDVRDKRFVRASAAAVESFDIKNSAGSLHIVRKDGKWVAPDRADWQMDQDGIKDFLKNLVEAKSQEIVTEKTPTSAEMSKFGLNKAVAHVQFVTHEKTWKGDFGLGGDKVTSYVAGSDPKFVFKIDKSTLDKAMKTTLASLRDGKVPFTFDKGMAKSIEVQTKLKSFALHIDANKTWTLTDAAPNMEVQQDKVKDFLEKLGTAKASEWGTAADTKKFKGDSRVVIKGDEDKVLLDMKWSEAFKKKVDDGEKSVRWVQSNLAKDVVLVDDSNISRLTVVDLVKAKADPVPGVPGISGTQAPKASNGAPAAVKAGK